MGISKINRNDLLLIFSLIVGFCFVKGLGGSLWPFLIALFGAYFALPLVQRLEKKGVPRLLGTLLFLLLFAIVTGIGLYFLLPYLWEEGKQLVNDAPTLFTALFNKARPWLQKMGADTDNLGGELQNWIFKNSQGLQSQLANRLTWLLTTSVQNVFGLVMMWLQILMAPIFFLFILSDFDKFKNTLIAWIPKEMRAEVLEFFNRAHQIMGSFFRGQTLLALSLATFYSLGLWIVGLPYGFLIGFFSGVLSFIPYVGFSVGLITSVAVGAASTSWSMALAAALVYISGQALDGVFLTPRLVGKAVGLRPLGAILAAIIGANLFGFPGVLLGIPLVACTRELWIILKKGA